MTFVAACRVLLGLIAFAAFFYWAGWCDGRKRRENKDPRP